ncbi:MAG: Na+/H+ antiporter subunit E [Candidatus Diapherotrites archaeon]
MKNFLLFYLFSYVFWLLLTAFSGQIIFWSFEALFVGASNSIFPALIAHLLFKRLGYNFTLKYLNPIRLFLLTIYIFGPFLISLIRANLSVAYLLLTGKTRPAIVEIDPKIKSNIGLVMLGNSITLTPGTLTLDIKDGKLYVHCLNSRNPKPKTEEVCGSFADWIRRITK